MNPLRILENISAVREHIAHAQNDTGIKHPVCILAVTKTQSAANIETVLSAGLTHIGENKVQEAENKFAQVKTTVHFIKHMVGHLQSNKINRAMLIFDRIDSVDSLELAKKINAKALEKNQKREILLEINTSREKQKFGFKPDQIDEMLECLYLKNIRTKGLMTVGSANQSEAVCRKAFSELRELMENINRQSGSTKILTELSMGMSDDYIYAVKEGSTTVRLGTAIFGPRQYF